MTIYENGDDKQRIEYADICKTIKQQERTPGNTTKISYEKQESPKNAEARPRQTDHTHGHDRDKIIERIEELYTELYDSEQSTIIHIDPKDVPEITLWEVEAALRDMKNGTATGNDHIINIETLKTGEDITSKPLAKLYTKYLAERRIPKAWKNAKMVRIFKKGNKKYLQNYRPINLVLSTTKHL